MRIAIDCFNFVGLIGGSGGAGAYCLSLIKNMSTISDVTVVCSKNNQSFFSDPIFSAAHIYVGETHQSAFNQLADVVDVVYSPFTELPGGNDFPESIKFVTAIHDLQHHFLKSYFPLQERLERDAVYLNAARRADGIITFSNVEKKNIERAYNPRAQISVIPHAPYMVEWVNEYFGERLNSYRPLSEVYGDYIFFPAVNWPHKNHYRLLEAFLMIRSNGFDNIKLITTGASCVESRKHFYKDLLNLNPDLESLVIELGFVSSRQVYALIKDAKAVIFPTLYEGFGIPMLEAIVLGKPVIASKLEVFEEWFANRYYPILNPRDPISIARAMIDFLGNDRIKENNIEYQFFWDKNFSSQCVAQSTLRFLENVVSSSRSRGSSVYFPSQQILRKSVWQSATIIDVSGLSMGDQLQFENRLLKFALYAQDFRHRFILFGMKPDFTNESSENIDRIYDHDNQSTLELTFEWLTTNELDCDVLTFLVASDFAEIVAVEDYIKHINNLRSHVDKDKVTRMNLDPFFKKGTKLSFVSSFIVGRELLNSCIGFPSDDFVLEWDRQASVVSKGFAIVEPALKNFIGHYFYVAKSISACASLAGLTPIVGASKNFDAGSIKATVQIEPIFSSYDKPFPEGPSPSQFCEEMFYFLSNSNIGSGDYVYMHMPYPYLLIGLAEFLTTANAEDLPIFLIRICSDDVPYKWFSVRMSKIINAILESGIRRNNVRFFVESKNLQDYFLFNCNKKFPLLVNTVTREMKIAGKRRICSSNKIHIGYLGEAREEKGFQLLPGIISQLLDKYGKDKIEFTIQMTSNANNETEIINAAKESIYELYYQYKDAIKLVTSTPDMVEYYQLMVKCDVVLLPYSPVNYAFRGTGIALEALALGAIIVVTGGTDIEATYKGRGCIATRNYSQDAFVEAISNIIGDIKNVKKSLQDRLLEDNAIFKDEMEFMSSLLNEGVLEVQQKKTMLWIGNDTLRQGCSSVYASQREFFRNQGYDIYNVYVPFPDGSGHIQEDEWLTKYLNEQSFGWSDGGFDFSSYSWLLNQQETDDRRKLILEYICTGGASTKLLWELNGYAKIPQSLSKFIENRRIDVVCLNYIHLYPIVQKLGLKAPVILESHDIQCYQHAVRASRTVDQEDLDWELAQTQLADQIVVVSASEKALFDQYFINSKTTWIVPTPVKNDGYLNDWQLSESCLQPYMVDLWLRRKDLQQSMPMNNPEEITKFLTWLFINARREYDLSELIGIEEYRFLTMKGKFGLTKMQELVWNARPDLQGLFPEPYSNSNEEFLEWFLLHGRLEYSLDEHGGPVEFSSNPNGIRLRETGLLEAIVLARPKLDNIEPFFLKIYQWLHKYPTLDVLIVASDHPANIRSVKWFFSTVMPLLAKNVSVLIVGRSCQVIMPIVPAHLENVYLLGEVEHLDPLYRVAKVVAAPVIAGSGIPIKVLDAIQRGCAVSATRFIDPAGRFSDFGFPLFERGSEMASDIKELLETEDLRQERIKAGQRYYASVFSPESYQSKWLKLLDHVGL